MDSPGSLYGICIQATVRPEGDAGFELLDIFLSKVNFLATAVVVNLLPHMCVLCQSIVCGCWSFMDKFTFWMCYDVRPHGLLCVVLMFKFVTSGHSFITPQHDAFCVTRLGARRHRDVSFSFGSPV
jgi:hypothetical protein